MFQVQIRAYLIDLFLHKYSILSIGIETPKFIYSIALAICLLNILFDRLFRPRRKERENRCLYRCMSVFVCGIRCWCGCLADSPLSVITACWLSGTKQAFVTSFEYNHENPFPTHGIKISLRYDVSPACYVYLLFHNAVDILDLISSRSKEWANRKLFLVAITFNRCN